MPAPIHREPPAPPGQLGLEWFRKRFFAHEPSISAEYVELWVTGIALLHPKEVSAWMESLLDYCQAEGLNPMEYLLRQVDAVPEYRRKKARTRHR